MVYFFKSIYTNVMFTLLFGDDLIINLNNDSMVIMNEIVVNLKSLFRREDITCSRHNIAEKLLSWR